MRFGESVVNGGNVQPYRHTGMEMQSMHGLNWIDNKARMRTVNVPEFTTIDPLAEDNYEISPYAYAVNNPINYIDPDGQDYWSTNDPTQIAQFLQTLRSRNYSIKSVASFDMSGWQHATDAQFTGNLTYNDKTKTFYSSYGTVENGETTIHGVSVKASSIWDNGQGANIESPWLTQASGKANNVYPEFAMLAAGTKPGFAFIKWIWNVLNSPVVSTTNTFNANAGRQIKKMGRSKGNMPGNNQIQNKQIDNLANEYDLSKEKRNELHRLISGEGYGYKEIEELIKEYFSK